MSIPEPEIPQPEEPQGTEPQLHSFQVRAEMSEGVAVLSWGGATNLETLQHAVSLATDDVIIDKGAHRVEVAVSGGDRLAQRALQRSGFRREGIRRDAIVTPDGPMDVWLYARLARDIAYGEVAFSSVMDTVLPVKRSLAHVLYCDGAGRILMCETSYKRDWELPGGVTEPGESPRQGAIREVQEEWGCDLPVGALLCVDWLPPYQGWSDAIQFVFDGGILSEDQIAQVHVDGREIVAVHRVSLEEIDKRTYLGAAHRLRSILNADPADLPIYLEAGSIN